MAKPGEPTRRGTDERLAEERRAQGSTVAALNAFSARVPSKSRADLRYADPDDAIRALAAEVEQDTLRVPRLLVLDSLVRLASRRPAELSTHRAALDALLGQLVRQAQGPEADLGVAVATVRSALESVALSSVGADRHPWQVFAQQAAPALRLSQAEIEKPVCNDREVVVKGPDRAVGVTVEFFTDASPGELRNFCDPRRWHECSAYQKEMTEWTGDGAKPDEDRPPNGWRRDLLETVELAPGREPLETPLRFTYTIQDPDDPHWVHLDYLLIRETDDIKVDEGALDVRRVTSGQQRGRTRVSAKKAILFKGLLAQWPTVACDTFWMGLVIDAAVGCLGPGAAIDSAGGEPKMAASKELPLAKVIEDATDAARQSITTYGKLANEAATQLTGDSPAAADKWVELTTKTWAQAARDTAQAWTTYIAFLRAVAESGGKTEQPATGGADTDETEPEGNGTPA